MVHESKQNTLGDDGLAQISQKAEQFAHSVPLVTVAEMDVVLAGKHFTSAPNSVARDCEEHCGWRASKYFYPGIACPEFGGVAFAHNPSMEQNKQGSASPFDSGGMWKKYLHPQKRAENDAVRIDFMKKTCIDLHDWRESFAKWLDSGYTEPKHFLKRKRPSPTLEWETTTNLPALDNENTDWRAWTWEVRIHQNIDFDDHLLDWACTKHTWDKLRREASKINSPTNPHPILAIKKPICAIDDEAAFRELEKKICQ